MSSLFSGNTNMNNSGSLFGNTQSKPQATTSTNTNQLFGNTNNNTSSLFNNNTNSNTNNTNLTQIQAQSQTKEQVAATTPSNIFSNVNSTTNNNNAINNNNTQSTNNENNNNNTNLNTNKNSVILQTNEPNSLISENIFSKVNMIGYDYNQISKQAKDALSQKKSIYDFRDEIKTSYKSTLKSPFTNKNTTEGKDSVYSANFKTEKSNNYNYNKETYDKKSALPSFKTNLSDYNRSIVNLTKSNENPYNNVFESNHYDSQMNRNSNLHLANKNTNNNYFSSQISLNKSIDYKQNTENSFSLEKFLSMNKNLTNNNNDNTTYNTNTTNTQSYYSTINKSNIHSNIYNKNIQLLNKKREQTSNVLIQNNFNNINSINNTTPLYRNLDISINNDFTINNIKNINNSRTSNLNDLSLNEEKETKIKKLSDKLYSIEGKQHKRLLVKEDYYLNNFYDYEKNKNIDRNSASTDNTSFKNQEKVVDDKILYKAKTANSNISSLINVKFTSTKPTVVIEKQVSTKCCVSDLKIYITDYIKNVFEEDYIQIDFFFQNREISDDMKVPELYKLYEAYVQETRSFNSLSVSDNRSEGNYNINHLTLNLNMKIKSQKDLIKEQQVKEEKNSDVKSNRNSENFSFSSNNNTNFIDRKIIFKKAKLVKKSDLPILTKPYQTIPNMMLISRMKYRELENVKDFTIYDNNARITFPGVTNLCGLNIDEIVSIKFQYVSIYKENPEIKPEVGFGLNKQAIIELFHVDYKNYRDENVNSFVTNLAKKIESEGGRLIRYDAQNKVAVYTIENCGFN